MIKLKAITKGHMVEPGEIWYTTPLTWGMRRNDPNAPVSVWRLGKHVGKDRKRVIGRIKWFEVIE